jgi:hypothetical protein
VLWLLLSMSIGWDCVSELRPPTGLLLFILKLSHYSQEGAYGDRMYRSYLLMTSALDGCEWSASRPGRALPPEKGPPVSIVKEAGWSSEPVWTQRLEEKSFCLFRGSNPDRPVVQPVARRLFKLRMSMQCEWMRWEMRTNFLSENRKERSPWNV